MRRYFMRMMLASTDLCVLCFGLPNPARAQFATPEAAVRAVYALYRTNGGPGFPSDGPSVSRFLEPALARAWTKDSAGASEGKKFLGADPFIQAQDWDISGLSIQPSQVTGDRASVPVAFRNFNKPVRLTYRLARGQDGWRIYDVTSTRGQGLRRDLGLRN